MNDVPKTIEAVWKIGATRLLTAIARITHNIRIAEELAQESPGHCAPALAEKASPKIPRLADEPKGTETAG